MGGKVETQPPLEELAGFRYPEQEHDPPMTKVAGRPRVMIYVEDGGAANKELRAGRVWAVFGGAEVF